MKVMISRFLSFRSIQNARKLYTSHPRMEGAYDGPGKTTVTILNKSVTSVLLIDEISPTGFMLNNGFKVIGPMVIFPKCVIGWNVGSSHDINEQSLTLFDVLVPKLDLLFLGLENNYDFQFMSNLWKMLKKKNISCEVLPVYQAVCAYNYACSDGRHTAACLIPPVEQSIPFLEALKKPGKPLADKKFLKE